MIKNLIKSLFRKVFPEPTEEKLLEKSFTLLNSLKRLESKIDNYERYERFSNDVRACEDLIEKVKSIPHGKRKPLLNVTVAFIRLHKSMYTYF